MQRLVQHSLAMVAALGVVAWTLSPRATRVPEEAPETLVLEARDAPVAGKGFGADETVIERDGSGQFHLEARINGQDTRFLIDTGADIVALTQADADRLGIHIPPEDYQPIVRTASGVGKAARVQIDRLEFGDEEFRDIDALVAEGLDVNLLGQSVLRRLGSVELKGDRMVIAHR